MTDQRQCDDPAAEHPTPRSGAAREVRRVVFTVVAYGIGTWFLLFVVLPSVDSQF